MATVSAINPTSICNPNTYLSKVRAMSTLHVFPGLILEMIPLNALYTLSFT